MTEYVTVEGDTWDLIAWKVFKSARYLPELMNANRDNIPAQDTVIFSAGTRIKIPDVSRETKKSTPPWKR